LSEEQRRRFAERQHQINLAKTRNEKHIGMLPPERQQKRQQKLKKREEQKQYSSIQN
jgi:UPF0176 protein